MDLKEFINRCNKGLIIVYDYNNNIAKVEDYKQVLKALKEILQGSKDYSYNIRMAEQTVRYFNLYEYVK